MADVSLRDRRQALLDQEDLRGLTFCQAYARAADEWLAALAERASGGDSARVALVAVGGYGRGLLWPYSDLDVVLVHDGRRDVGTLADAIWYPVWDQGVKLDHSVRRPKEAMALAAEDLRVALGLLDARCVWGDNRVATLLIDKTKETWRYRLGARWAPTLGAQMEQRHRSNGDVAFLLEPDLKESHGGQRDVNMLRAFAAYAPLLTDYVNLASLDPAQTLLSDVRVELHRRAGRALDVLLLQEQDHVAEVLGFDDADALMAAVAEAGRTIAWLSDDAWRRRSLWQPDTGPKKRGLFRRRAEDEATTSSVGEGDVVEVEPGVAVIGGEVLLTPSADVAGDASLTFRLAAVAAERELPIARRSLHRLADTLPPPPDPWPGPMREALVRVLSAGPGAIDALEALDHEHLLTRLLPEWEAVRNRPQRNAYHRFTVDRHLLEAAANAALLATRVGRPDLLVVAALFHDIGKGYPGDHTAAGIDVVQELGRRLGFDEADVTTLVQLVRFHLLLPDTATRRDLEDPATIEAVAEAVGDRGTLELLAALTEADSLATGPAAWGGWKAGLVAELVSRVNERLAGRPSARRRELSEAHRQLMAEAKARGGPVLVLDPPALAVASPDRPGLLTSVTGVLALHNLDVRSADARSEDGVAVELFTVDVGSRRWPEASRLTADLEAVLAGRLPLDDRLAEKARDYAGTRRTMAVRTFETQVLVDNAASDSSSVVEVRALDDVGLLHRVTRALFDQRLDVASARVSTVGREVVDAFYVRHADGQKVTDDDALKELLRAVREALN